MAKIALLGLGKVGLNVLRQASSTPRAVRLHAIADSSCVISSGPGPFSGRDLLEILELKERAGGSFAEGCERELSGCRVYRFDSANEESDILRELSRGSLREWVVLDASSSGAEADLSTVRGMMGSLAYCTANKKPWADYRMCSRLFDEARETLTLLGLNCTAGVWADQMEVLPLALRLLRRGGLTVLKRDNSSFNLFFSLTDSGMGADEALREVADRGHLEPGATGLVEEVEDQTIKARIAANVCGVVAGAEPSFEDPAPGAGGPPSNDPEDIAEWHSDGGRNYRALVSSIRVGLGRGSSIEAGVSFMELERGSALARDFPAKCAISVRALPGSLLASGAPAECRGYAHSGFGGAPRTAAKLLWEARRAARMPHAPVRRGFEPLPILSALSARERGAMSLASRIASRL